MLFKHNNRLVLLYQTEKSFDACNGSCCSKLIIYFDYCNTWVDVTIEVFHNSPCWNFFYSFVEYLFKSFAKRHKRFPFK